MKQVFRIMVILSLALAVLAILSGIGLWHEAGSHPGLSVSVNGDDLDLEGFGDLHGLGVIAGLGIAALVMCVVVPLLLLFSIGLPLLIICAVVLAVLAAVVFSAMSVGALLFSPLIVIGVVLYLLLRSKKPRPSRASIAP
ncbi:hypothetical protein BH11PSE10_BH11PSE10_13880 [soil metagenome]